MESLLIIIGALCVIIGFLGSVLPVLPGVPVSLVGLILIHFTDQVEFTGTQLGMFVLLTVATFVADYFLPIWFTKKFGGTKWGVWGSTLGLVAGLFFGPIGIIAGPMIGAFAGEMISNKDTKLALKAGVGSFIGFICNTGFNLIVSGYFLYVFASEILQNFDWNIPHILGNVLETCPI